MALFEALKHFTNEKSFDTIYWDKKNIQIDTQIRGVNQMGVAKKRLV